MLAGSVNQIEYPHQPDKYIPYILHGSKNVFIKKNYLKDKKDYLNYFLINTSIEKVKSHTILYNGTATLRRFYSGIPPFVPVGGDYDKIENFRKYVVYLNDDVVSFLSEKLTVLKEPDNPLAIYIIPELISNAVKSNFIIENKLSRGSGNNNQHLNCMIEVVCLINRKKPDNIDIIMRNYARFHKDVEKNIKDALNCRWTKKIKLEKEKNHRENSESSTYGLPSINNAIQKIYKGGLIYDGYDDSFENFGAYQFTMRLPKENTGVK